MFTAFQSICGALLIQFATTAFLTETGKTVGFSSIVYDAFFNPNAYALSIVTGLLTSTAFVYNYMPRFIPPQAPTSLLYSTLAGLFVGFGTSWGSGCTSGHMLCGLSLMRVRSLVATLVFSIVSIVVVNYFDLAPSCEINPCYSLVKDESRMQIWHLGLVVATGFLISKIKINSIFSGFKTGFLFGLGLFISGMANRAKPLGFLSVFHPEKFDPSLAMIMLFAVLPNIFQWKSIQRSQPIPLFEKQYSLPSRTDIPMKLLVGSALFGIGWGMHGVCPGPGVLTALLSYNSAAWLVAFLVGQVVAKRF